MNVLSLKAIPSLQDLEVINFEDCLMRTGGAKALANVLKNSHKKLKVRRHLHRLFASRVIALFSEVS